MFLATFSSHQWAHCAHYLMYKFLLSSNVQKYFQFVFLLFFCFWGATQRINIFEKKKRNFFVTSICYSVRSIWSNHALNLFFLRFFFLKQSERRKKTFVLCCWRWYVRMCECVQNFFFCTLCISSKNALLFVIWSWFLLKAKITFRNNRRTKNITTGPTLPAKTNFKNNKK